MDVELTRASEVNLTELLPLVLAYHQFEGINQSELDCTNSLRRLLSSQNYGHVWLINVDGELVGYIALCVGFSIEFSGLDAFVDEFFITPEFRNKGIGTKTLERVKEEAKKLGINAMHLEVARENEVGQANFKKREKYVLMTVLL